MNTVFLLGNLGKNVELKYTQSQLAFCHFSLATSTHSTDKSTGKRIDHTEWHNITCFGKLAELCSKYLHKGSKVLIEGSLRSDSYEKDGEKRKITKIVAKNVTFLDAKKQEGDSKGTQSSQIPDELPPEIPF